jgi:hypothetical protein
MKNYMKTIKLITLSTVTSLILLTACQRNAADELSALENKEVNATNAAIITEATNTQTGSRETLISNSTSASTSSVACNSNAYIITLESRTQVGVNWEWVWSVQNSNPGNGNNGTIQDLSNWGMQLGTCVIWSDVVAAAYSNNGSNWTAFIPLYRADLNQTCLTTPVLKFDYGTTGSAKTYYKLTLSHNYPEGIAFGYYKSGTKTGCCTFNFTGIGCDDDGGPR